MQETQVQAWFHLGRPHTSWSKSARVLQLLKPVRLEPVFCSQRSHRNKKLCTPTREKSTQR